MFVYLDDLHVALPKVWIGSTERPRQHTRIQRLAMPFGARTPCRFTTLIAGRTIACLSLLLGLLLYFIGVDHVTALFGPCMLVGVSNGLTMPSANAGAISVRPKLTGSAAGLASAIAVLGGAIMSTITGAVLTAENARMGLLPVMLSSAMIALTAALCVRHFERTYELGH